MSRHGEAPREPMKYRVYVAGHAVRALSTREPDEVADFFVTVKRGEHPDYPPDSKLSVLRREQDGCSRWLTPHKREALRASVSLRLGPGYDPRTAARRWQQLQAAKRATAHTPPPDVEDIAQTLTVLSQQTPTTPSVQAETTAHAATAQSPAKPSAWSSVE